MQPVKEFRDATVNVTKGTQQYFLEINKVEREAEIDKRTVRKQPIDIPTLDRTRLISSADLNARIKGLNVLLKQADLLTELASTGAPDAAAQKVDDLSTGIIDLEKTTASLAGSAGNATFKGAVGAFTPLAKLILQDILNHKATQALEKAIKDGKQPIQNLIAVIREDLGSVAAARQDALSASRVNAVDRYNEAARAEKPDPMLLAALAQDIKKAETEFELFMSASPLDAIDAFASAHGALVKFAETRSPADLSNLLKSLEFFVQQANILAQTAAALQKL